MSHTANVLYTGRTHTQGGRQGSARSDDGRLDVALTPPGAAGAGTNPEQLFAAGWSACFIGAIGHAARRMSLPVPQGVSVDAEVDLAQGDDGYRLQARLRVSLPGVDADTARALVDGAHANCPYSKATRGNIDVAIAIA